MQSFETVLGGKWVGVWTVRKTWTQKFREKLGLFGGFGERSGVILGLFYAIFLLHYIILHDVTLYYVILRYLT